MQERAERIQSPQSRIESRLRWSSGLLVTAIPFAALWLVLVIIRIIAGEFSWAGAAIYLLQPLLFIAGIIMLLKSIPKFREAWFIKKNPKALSTMQLTSILLLIMPLFVIVGSVVMVAIGIWLLRMWVGMFH
ncbi:MAG: hypothetical protein U9Q76_00945 [candidate division WOR-3 bacterium]|nr:hypothetical protein [candidate division WOR-3 bacterium]